MIKVYPSQRELWTLFNYESGKLVTKSKRGKWPAGRVAGKVSAKGRWVVLVNGIQYYRSILIYTYFYGPPKYEVDHLDRDKLNDKINNLEDLPGSDNCLNRKSSDRILPHGVYPHHTGKYTCAFRHKNLGVFQTIEEAHEEYLKAKGVTCIR